MGVLLIGARRPLGVSLVVVAIALIVADFVSSGWAREWTDRPMAAGLISGGLLLFITVIFIDDRLRARDKRRKAYLLQPMVQLLKREAAEMTEALRQEVDPQEPYGERLDRESFARDAVSFRRLTIDLAPLLADREDGRLVLTRAQSFAHAYEDQVPRLRDAPDEEHPLGRVPEQLQDLRVACDALAGEETHKLTRR